MVIDEFKKYIYYFIAVAVETNLGGDRMWK